MVPQEVGHVHVVSILRREENRHDLQRNNH